MKSVWKIIRIARRIASDFAGAIEDPFTTRTYTLCDGKIIYS